LHVLQWAFAKRAFCQPDGTGSIPIAGFDYDNDEDKDDDEDEVGGDDN
jgi:hypothetical protein